jgi:hypothetical protein
MTGRSGSRGARRAAVITKPSVQQRWSREVDALAQQNVRSSADYHRGRRLLPGREEALRQSNPQPQLNASTRVLS